ncbi:hypothetical protein FE257_008066 [Aspergillus nanangensis]|uniref:MaoC-like domain-containing protein n=1 Tax=Aspergillus nanangensis TaxID=2582783 RepID=A0AAD4CM64_ASPNN|nr:hypothetical protein FE257_008066 [Aspergillus nanangensis]
MDGGQYKYHYPDKDVTWLKRDTLLFHLSIGIPTTHLQYLYEGHPAYDVFPTFPTVLAYKGTEQDIVDYRTMGKPTDIHLPGIPKFDRSRVVDAHKRIILHKPLAAIPAKHQSLAIQQELTGIYDKGLSGTLIETASYLVDRSSGSRYATIIGAVMARGQGGWGGSRGPSLATFPVPATTQPDYVHVYQTTHQTPLLFRLNGDYNPLHAEPSHGRQMGLGGVVIHGLFTWNVAAYAVCEATGALKIPTAVRLKDFQARFASPVYPGDALTTQMWEMAHGTGAEGHKERIILFTVRNQDGTVVLSNGRALFRSTSKGSSAKM